MSSDAPLAPGGGERRLHPWSWLFVLLQQLKAFALPLLVLLFGAGGNTWELWGLLGGGVLVVIALAQYFTYRFRIDADGVVIRSGLLQRSLRHVPWQRVHNVALHQTLLHRLFGVAEVRLESAGGGARPEAEMRVLSLADAHALEALVRARGDAAGTVPAATDSGAAATGDVLLALSTAEVVRLGLISNRGALMLGAAVALLAQTGDDLLGRAITGVGRRLLGFGERLHLDAVGWVVGAVVLLVFAIVALRVLSIAWNLLHFHGFTLTDTGRRLSVQRGLLTRSRANMPRDRIQAWTLREGLTQRLLGRRSLEVDSASATGGENDRRSLRELAPVITPEAGDALVRHLLPRCAWPPTRWQPLHPRAWRRQMTLPALVVIAAAGVVAVREGPWGLALLALLPLLYVRARIWARHAGWSLEGGLLVVREGWIDRSWRFAELRRVQALSLSQSPFDRRHGMATLLLDTAGASPFAPPLRIRYLPEAVARELHATVAAALASGEALTPARTAGSAAPAA